MVAGDRLLSSSPPPLFIVSWNVAGLPTTWTCLSKCYPGDSGFFEFLNRWGADVVAIQEAKVSKGKLDEDPRACGATGKRSDAGGWESFWAHSLRGMNGVVTFAKAGLVHSADSAPLRDPELDSEGRCVVTRFSAFTLFNVYAPNSRGGARSEFRERYIRSLYAAIEREREAHPSVPVVLAGDLNMTYRCADAHWSFLRLDVTALVAGIPTDTSCATEWTAASVDAFVPPTQRFRIVNQVLARSGLPPISQGDWDAALVDKQVMADLRARIANTLVEVERASAAPSSHDSQAAWSPNADVMPDVLAPHVDVLLPRPREATHEANEPYFRAVYCFGRPAHHDVAVRLMRTALKSMRDSLLVARPDTVARVTCFNQMTNARYQHQGSRIDYILVDNALAEFVVPGPGPLPGRRNNSTHSATTAATDPLEDLQGPPLGCGNTVFAEHADALSVFNGSKLREGLNAVTEYGRFQPVPFTGGGMAPLAMEDCERLFVAPHQTGIGYTAPQLSDHLAVTTLLRLPAALVPRASFRPASSQQQQQEGALLDATTKACMYRPKHRSVLQMFANVSAAAKEKGSSQPGGGGDGENACLTRPVQSGTKHPSTSPSIGRAKQHRAESTVQGIVVVEEEVIE